ncbi:hypothetical protein EELLY_v1c00590 [Entomoplasma ellychniae]|uniref:Lipoprotein-associated type-17 domain-containing protein n=1 Tax=Entomoplasma ellychniae TaxID=2114 RepID=A0A8E2QXR1_9MOLU|nr:hypothetical protein [Entomoplasma ellychniae]PPE04384.1 hypothetical protein EELLY_v1c00590 [Entomoplasma ellychniae]
MKKLLQLLTVVTILPTVSMAAVSCDVSFKSKEKSENKTTETSTKRIKNTELKLEVESLLKDKTFNSVQEAAEFIATYKDWKAEGVLRVQASIFTETDAASIAITPILKEGYEWLDTYGNVFEVYIKVDLNNEINKKIEEIKNNKYDEKNLESAKTEIIQEIKKIKGISSVELNWTDENLLKYSLKLVYKQNFSGPEVVNSETKTYTNLKEAISSVKSKIQEKGYSTNDDAKSTIIRLYNNIEGVKDVTFEWENSVNYKYRVNLTFESTYYSDDTNVSDSLVKNESVGKEVEQIFEVVKNKKYNIADENIEEELIKPFNSTNYLESVKFSWLSQPNNTYKLTFNYKKGYFGPETLSAKILPKMDITDMIKGAITNIEFENKGVVYENALKVQEIFSKNLKQIKGVQTLDFSTNANNDNTYKLSIKVSYDDENYFGNKTFESNFEMKKPIDDNVLKQKSIFENQEFKNLDAAKEYISNTLPKIEGVKEIVNITSDSETKNVKFTVITDELHSMQYNVLEWKADLKFSEIKPIDNQELSWVNGSQKKYQDIKLSGYKLIGKDLTFKTDVDNLISITEYEKNNNKYLSIQSLTNVAGVKTVKVDVQVYGQPESQVSFEVKIIGQPVITTEEPWQVDIARGKNKDVHFHIDFYDDASNILDSDQEDNYITTSIIKEDVANGLYILKIYGVKKNKLFGSQKAYIKWNGQTLWTVRTKVSS